MRVRVAKPQPVAGYVVFRRQRRLHGAVFMQKHIVELARHDGPLLPLPLQPCQQVRVAALQLLRHRQQDHVFSRAVTRKRIQPARHAGLRGLDQRGYQRAARLHDEALAVQISPAVLGPLGGHGAESKRGLACGHDDVAPHAHRSGQLGVAGEIEGQRTQKQGRHYFAL